MRIADYQQLAHTWLIIAVLDQQKLSTPNPVPNEPFNREGIQFMFSTA